MSDWVAFLQQQGAVLNAEGQVVNFGNPDAEREAAVNGQTLCDLGAGLVLLGVTGEDAEQFLQGQLTNDVREVTQGKVQLSSWCTHKGRVQSSFYILPHAGGYYLLVARSRLEAMLKRLKMFVLRSKVSLEAVTDKACVAVTGRDSAALVGKITGLSVPDTDKACTSSDSLSLCRLTAERYLVIGDVAALQEVWTQGAASAQVAAFDSWQLQEILAGIPLIDEPNAEAFVPQMLNLHLIDGVSFKKGCYTGQEIVARSQYLGEVKRRMYLAHLESDVAPQAGELLYADVNNGEEAGRIVNAQAHPDGGYVLLAVLKKELADEQVIHWQDLSGPMLAFMSLPYEVPSAAA